MAKVRPGAEVYNAEFLESVLYSERSVKTWLSQQPDLDLVYVNKLEDINSQLVKQYLTKI